MKIQRARLSYLIDTLLHLDYEQLLVATLDSFSIRVRAFRSIEWAVV